jgi:hypothetical protein
VIAEAVTGMPPSTLDAALLMERIEHRHSPLSVDNQANASLRVPDYVSCFQSSRLTLYGNWFTLPTPPNSILLDFTSNILWGDSVLNVFRCRELDRTPN